MPGLVPDTGRRLGVGPTELGRRGQRAVGPDGRTPGIGAAARGCAEVAGGRPARRGRLVGRDAARQVVGRAAGRDHRADLTARLDGGDEQVTATHRRSVGQTGRLADGDDGRLCARDRCEAVVAGATDLGDPGDGQRLLVGCGRDLVRAARGHRRGRRVHLGHGHRRRLVAADAAARRDEPRRTEQQRPTRRSAGGEVAFDALVHGSPRGGPLVDRSRTADRAVPACHAPCGAPGAA